MDLIINPAKPDVYKVKVGAEVFSIEYPSWNQARKIEKSLVEVQSDSDKVAKYIEDMLVELGLDKKFFKLDGIKSHHIFKIWGEINTLKK